MDGETQAHMDVFIACLNIKSQKLPVPLKRIYKKLLETKC